MPWRSADCPPWGVLVSEIMLQQTPVVRVLPVWEEWLRRWPEPADLAGEPAGEAVRVLGPAGLPAARPPAARRGGRHRARPRRQVPRTTPSCSACRAWAATRLPPSPPLPIGRRETVVDTNIRRVHARLFSGTALPSPALTAAEMRLAAGLLPDDAGTSVRWNASVMELGALVCTARAPKCAACPVRERCAWLAAGEPPPSYTPKGQAWHGTDRQVRGAVMAVLRLADAPVPAEMFQQAPADLGLRGRRDRRSARRPAPAELGTGTAGAGTRRASGGRPRRAPSGRLPAPRLMSAGAGRTRPARPAGTWSRRRVLVTVWESMHPGP